MCKWEDRLGKKGNKKIVKFNFNILILCISKQTNKARQVHIAILFKVGSQLKTAELFFKRAS